MPEEEIQGLAALKEKFEQLPLVLRQKYLAEATKNAAELIRATAARKAPRGATGKLQDTMTMKVSDQGPAEVIVDVGPSKEAWYGRFVEFGTIKMKAQPFLRPAFDENQQRCLEMIGKELGAAIEAEGQMEGTSPR